MAGTVPVAELGGDSGVLLPYEVLVPHSKWWVVGSPLPVKEPLRVALVRVMLLAGSACTPATAWVMKVRSMLRVVPLALLALTL